MEWNSIKDSLLRILDVSIKIKRACEDNSFLFDWIDNLSNETKNSLKLRFQHDNGPVLSIRKQVVNDFINGKVNQSKILQLFSTGKTVNAKKFTMYKDLFSVLYPFLTYDQNDFIHDTLYNLADLLRSNLNLNSRTDIKVVGFDGGRNIGSEKCWFAIYNNSHPNQQTAKQLFFAIENGIISFGLYDRPKDFFIEKKEVDPKLLQMSDLDSFFRKHIDLILADNFRSNILTKYPIEKLIKLLQASQIAAWLIKPGEKGSLWKRALKDENIRIGWGYAILDVIKNNNYSDEFILKVLTKHYPKFGINQTNNKNTIKSFLEEVESNDVVFAVSGTSEIIGVGVIASEVKIDNKDDEYPSYHDVDWLIDLSKKPFEPNKNLPIKTVTELSKEDAIFYLTNIFLSNVVQMITSNMNTDSVKLPNINTILYGPPGTGKTYSLKIYKDKFFTDTNSPRNNDELLREIVAPYPKWQIYLAVMIAANKPLSVSEIVNHPLVKAKRNPSTKTSPTNIAWADLLGYADEGSTDLQMKYKRKLKIFKKNEDSKWTYINLGNLPDVEVEIAGPELVKLAKNPNVNIGQSSTINSRYNFITFHQKYSYEDFIEGIKPVLVDGEATEESENLQFELKHGVFYESCLKALNIAGYVSFDECKADTFENRKEKFASIKSDPKKQFALFIDEVNRANISAVFGELITLLEEDKRIGSDNEIWIELPYSKEKFCVPGNLYVIGTMNTADRSIALLDIALRRRFEFQALYPDYMDNVWWAEFLKKLNGEIYTVKKNPDFFIGHAFFINKDEGERKDILNKKIIPLLMEYFQNNSETVKKILYSSGVTLKVTTIKENYQIIAE